MEKGYFQDWNCLPEPVTAEDERYNGSSSANEESGIAVQSDLENPAPSYVYCKIRFMMYVLHVTIGKPRNN